MILRMAKYDSIIQNARALPLADRIRLARMLLEEASVATESDELGAGKRGLAALTDSTRGEDWSQFYPSSLQSRKVG